MLATPQLANALHDLAKQAGKAIMAHYKSGVEVQHKVDYSPVTAADLSSNDILTRGIRELMPHVALISEEGNKTLPPNGAPYFLIDPLDGTREFLSGNDEFCVCIALIEEGYPTLGVLYAPATQQIWSSHLPLEYPSQAPRKALVSRSHQDASTLNHLKEKDIKETLSVGSALKFAYLAERKASYYPRLTSINTWDVAAGQAVLEAHGGKMLDKQGNRIKYASLTAPLFFASV